MFKAVLVWLLKFSLERLGHDLDAEARAQLDEYNRKRAAVEATEEAAAIELGRIEQQVRELEQLRVDSMAKIEFTESVIEAQEMRLTQLDEKRKSNLDALARLSDDDLLRTDL